MIRVAETISIPEDELSFAFARSSGPGGQYVNKVETAVELRFDAARSPSLPDSVRARLLRLAGSRASSEGVVIFFAQRFRSQEKNREDAVSRLLALIQKAATPPKPRRKTRPTLASKERRLTAKRRTSGIKRDRKPVSDAD